MATTTRRREAIKPSEPAVLARRKKAVGLIAHYVLLACVLFGLLMLVALLVDVAIEGLPWVRPTLFNSYHSRHPEEAGMKSAIVGSVIILALTALFSFPLGVGTAVYLEEYAPKHWLTNLININISNLAGVPSVIYGLLGLAVFARFFGAFQPGSPLTLLLTGQPALLLGQQVQLPFSVADALGWEAGARGGFTLHLLGLAIKLPFEKSLLAGSLTMTLLVLPTVIIAAREAVRAVPSSIREAAYALGATPWQVTSRQVLPAAIPGILTGMILALGRAMGEAAPLIILGAYTYVPFLPASIWDVFTVMPIQIYLWISLPQHEFRFNLAGAGILVLLVVLLAMNALAVYLRNKFEIKW